MKIRKPISLLLVAFLMATTVTAQWVVTPSAPVSSYSFPSWAVDADMNSDYMAITYGNQYASTATGSTGTFLKVYNSSNAPITGDIPVFNLGAAVSRVKISNANIIYVLGAHDYSAVTKLVLTRFNTAGVFLGSTIVNPNIAGDIVDLTIADNGDVLVSLFEGNNLKIRCYESNLAYKGIISVANAITDFSWSNLKSQFMDFENGSILIGYSRGADVTLTSYIKKYTYNIFTPASSMLIETHPFLGGFSRKDLILNNSHQVALRSNGDIIYVNGISGIKRISGSTTTTMSTLTKAKVNADANNNVLISWTINAGARARLYNSSNAVVHSYSEVGNINGSWASAFYNCKFVIAGEKSNQGTDYSTVRNPYFQVFNCSNCEAGGPATASAEFRFPNQVVQLNSKYGPQDVTELCLVDDLLVNGSASCNEDGYFVEIAEFNLMTWTDVTVLYSAWVCTSCQAPNNINIASFLPQGYQLRPNKIYRFRLAVGTPWHSVDLFFKIACCEREIGEHDEKEEYSEVIIREDEEGSQDVQEGSPLKIFPNPAKDEVTLDFSNLELSGEVTVSIKDFSGKELFATTTLEKTLQVNIAPWQSGIYICTVTIDGVERTERIIKE